MKACVIGGSGFLGLNIIAGLAKVGWCVTSTVRSSSGRKKLEQALYLENISNVGIELVDVLSISGVHNEKLNSDFDLVINATGYSVQRLQTNAEIARKVNAELPLALMKFFDRPNVSKYIQLGTAYEYGPQNGALDESSATTPNTLYGKSKLAGKLSLFNSEIRESTLFYLRLFGIFGSYETPTKLFPQLYRTIVESETIEFSDGLQRVDYMHCQNLVKAIIKIHEFEPTQDRYLFVLGSGVPKSLRQISRCFRRLYPDSPPIEWGQSNRRKSGADVQYANTRNARDLLGWCPDASLKDGIRQFCKEMALVKDSVSI